MNYKAVRAVKLHTLNRQRANLVLSYLMQDDEVLTPEEISKRERIFEWDGALRWQGSRILGISEIGVSLSQLLTILAPAQAHKNTGAVSDSDHALRKLIAIHKDEDFLVWYNPDRQLAMIVLKTSCSARTQLKAWAVVLWVVHDLSSKADSKHATSATIPQVFNVIQGKLDRINQRWDRWIEQMESAGFNTAAGSLETTSGIRMRLTK